MSDPLWARLIEVMHKDGMTLDIKRQAGYSDNLTKSDLWDIESRQIETIQKKLDCDVDPGEIREAIRYLSDVGLIEMEEIGRNVGPFGLSEKGFDVAHQRILQKQQEGREDKRNTLL